MNIMHKQNNKKW